MDQIQLFIKKLMETSTAEQPAWNVEVKLDNGVAKWNYVDGCMIKAILEMYKITEEKTYLNFADAFIDKFVSEEGVILGLDVAVYNIDNINAGKVLFELYAFTGKAKYRKGIEFLYDLLQSHPRTEAGNFWHKGIYPNQVWLDGLYMAQPFYMAYETKFNNLGKYRDIFKQFETVHKLMRDDKTGLYYHGYDESRAMHWCDKTTGLSPNFWSRSMGWYVMALVDTLEEMSELMFYEYRTLMSYFKEAIETLLKFQDEETGMWYQVIDKGEIQGNYLETSGSAMISYAILKGVRLEFLPERYKGHGQKAYKGIMDRYLTTSEAGINLGGICLVAGLGGDSMRDGSFEYYISEPVVENDAKGVGPFLFAYTETLRD
ncbi:glycoside hydrolase family 105 protein [Fusibacter sp. 3D3]|uniref:glycoside hydrolase family 88/105 protein n=1 Tax=Fusibacter sp. 3D3 TaxID=1048380 RepID=UPI000853A8CA|nr:glycoside hydrolase family 88 protein [Fusibacter sp. 3D3]GAU75737.1 rhamnogalacturonides degradation protein RhiN [Fusibacter sp. 3D3]